MGLIEKLKQFANNLLKTSKKGSLEIARDLMGDDQRLQKLAISLNRDQLMSGKLSTGVPTGSYSVRHARTRRDRGLQTSKKDFKLGGDFQGEMFIEIVTKDKGIFDIRTNSLNGNRVVHENPDALGLTSESLKEFNLEFKKELMIKLKTSIYGK